VLFGSTQARTGDGMPQNGGTNVAVTGCFELYDTQCCTRFPCLATSSAITRKRPPFYECQTVSVVMRDLSHLHNSITQRCTRERHSKGSLGRSQIELVAFRSSLTIQLVFVMALLSLWMGVRPGILCHQGDFVSCYSALMLCLVVW